MNEAIQIATLISVVLGFIGNAAMLLKYFVSTEHRFTKLEVSGQHLHNEVKELRNTVNKTVDSNNRT